MYRTLVKRVLGGVTVGSVLVLVASAARAPQLPLSPAPQAGQGAGQARASGDYLTSDLRQAVEQLKRDVRSGTAVADVEALYRRATVLYAWANAFRQVDPVENDIPWGLPSTVAAVSRTRFLRGDEPARRGAVGRFQRTLDDLVLQLAERDENPRAIGRAVLRNAGPHTVGSSVTIEVEYVVGTRPIQPGTSFQMTTHNASGIRLQSARPRARDYVTVRTSRAGVTVRAEGAGPEPDAADAGDPDERAEEPARRALATFHVEGGALQPGDTVTFRLGDTSGRGPGLRMQPRSNDFIPIELHVQFEPEGTRFVLPRMGLKTHGGPVAGVHGFAPSVVKTGEPFALSVRSEDLYVNRATGPIPAYRVRLNGQPFREIAAGTEAIALLPGLAFSTPGVYRFTFESADGKIRGNTNPILVEDQPARRVYWGETHGHSGMAEGQGTSKAFFAYGRDDARLDFLVHSEHDIWLDDWEWEELRRNAIDALRPGEFVPFLGYEWTVDQSFGGHHNVLFRTPQGRRRVPQQTHPTLALLYQGLREQNRTEDVLIIPHAHQAGDWRINDPAMEKLTEIQSNHGVFELFGHMYLQHGHHVGFVSAYDDHASHPGYGVSRGRRYGLGAVIAMEKTPDALFDAMKALRTYAATGERVVLDVEVNGHRMGQRAPNAPVRRLTGRIIGTAPIDTVTVLKNSKEVWHADYRTASGALGPRERVEVNFASDSTPQDMQRDNPRSARVWSGTIDVRGARIAGVTGPGFVDALTQSFSIDPATPNVIRFRTWTRGNHSTLLLDLEDVTPATEVVVAVAPATERPGNFTRYRGVVQIPAFNARFTVGDAQAAAVRREQDVQGYSDRIELRRVRDGAPDDQRFEWVDDGVAREGDYYTVRIVQENDGLAWSSPIWVGGYPPRE